MTGQGRGAGSPSAGPAGEVATTSGQPARLTASSHDEDLLARVEQVHAFGGAVDAALPWIVQVGQAAPRPGEGQTALLWELLASTAAADVAVARMLEPHLDALAILHQAAAETQPPDLAAVGADETSSWGVYAAEGPGVRVTAQERDGQWTLEGVKPWCSLAQNLSHALVTAWSGEQRRLFAVSLSDPGVTADTGPWVSRGLPQVVSAPVRFAGARAVPVGPDQWYLRRPGFAWGGIGVAACWWGGAVGLGRALFAAAARREPDQIALMHLGAVDTALVAARTVLAQASAVVDAAGTAASGATGTSPKVLARRARTVVARAVEETIERAGHSLGPGPLALDEDHARRVADLAIYVRQHHAERDEAALGRDLLAAETAPW